MLGYAKIWLQSLAAVVFISGAAHAVTLDLSTAPSISNCQANLQPLPGAPPIIVGSGCLASVAYAPSLIANPTLNVQLGTPLTFDFLSLTATERDRFFPDLFTLSAALRILAPGAATFASIGLGTGFATDFFNGVNSSDGYEFINGNLTWGSIASQQVPGLGLVTVAFLPAVGSVFGAGEGGPNNPRTVILQARISVVPLPAGVLLLGSALLGLIALSRRRRSVAV